MWRRLMPPPSAELILTQLNGQLAVLEAARTELEAGWVQGGWWTVTSGDGSPRLVNAHPTAGGTPDHVDGVRLVGALVRAGSHRPEAESDVGRAVDAVYDALWAARLAGHVAARRIAAGTGTRGAAGPHPHAYPVERPGRTDQGGCPGAGGSRHQRHDHEPDVQIGRSAGTVTAMRAVLAAMAATVTQVTDVTANVTPVISARPSAAMPMHPATPVRAASR